MQHLKKTILTTSGKTLATFQPTWVKLKKYAELTGDTSAAVHARRRAGKWRDGVQCKVVDDALWINIQEVQGWLESWGMEVTPV